VSKPEAEATRA